MTNEQFIDVVKEEAEKYKYGDGPIYFFTNNGPIYFCTDIDEKTKEKIKKSSKAYNLLEGEKVLICYDSTVFGGANEGLVITNYGIHFRDKKCKYLSYSEIKDVKSEVKTVESDVIRYNGLAISIKGHETYDIIINDDKLGGNVYVSGNEKYILGLCSMIDYINKYVYKCDHNGEELPISDIKPSIFKQIKVFISNMISNIVWGFFYYCIFYFSHIRWNRNYNSI